MGSTVVLGEPPVELVAWLERRRALGQDLHDEVWAGEYHVAPYARSRHGDVEAQLAVILGPAAKQRSLRASGPVNIGVPENYRVPDLVVLRQRVDALYLPTAAIVIEVVSPGDESYRKFDFYFEHGVAEVLIVDPERRSAEWYRRGPEGFERAEGSALLDLTEHAMVSAIDWPPLGD